MLDCSKGQRGADLGRLACLGEDVCHQMSLDVMGRDKSNASSVCK